MTTPPFGGTTAPPSTQSPSTQSLPADPGTDGTKPDGAGPDLTKPETAKADVAKPDLAKPDLAKPETATSPSSADEFGATTISGSPRTATEPVQERSAPPTTATQPPVAVPGVPASGDGHPTTSSIRGIRAGRSRGPRRARLQIRHINPVTVLKFSCVLAIALFFVWLIIIGVLFGILDAAGVIDHVNETVTTLNGTGAKAPITAGIVFGGAAIIGVINIVLFIALSTIGAVIYNLCADLVGGVEITLSER